METKKKILLGVAIAIIILALWGGKFALGSYYSEQGKKYLAEGNFEYAKEYLLFSLYFNKQDPLTYIRLGMAELGPEYPENATPYPSANLQKAAEYYELALKKGISEKNSAAHSDTLWKLGFIKETLGDLESAERLYLEKTKKYPAESFWPYLQLAKYYFKINRPGNAADAAMAAVEAARAGDEKSNTYRAYSLLSRLSSYYEKYDDTEKFASLAIANAPSTNTSLDIQLAYLNKTVAAGTKKDFKKVDEYINKANNNAGKNIYGCTKALAYQKGGAYDKAIELAKNSIKNTAIDDVYSICLLTLGDAYLGSGNKKEAKKYYEDYLRLTIPTNIFEYRDSDRIKKELANL